MGREVRRVPLDFDWPLKEVWQGYLRPDRLHEDPCTACDQTGLGPFAKRLQDLWYGKIPYTPRKPLTPQSRAVWAFAKRNVERAPEFYGRGFDATMREATRLADMWNQQWSHHLEQRDVDALIAADRLRDLTHTFTKEDRWQPKDPMPKVTARDVNDWNILTMGHDSSNCFIVIRARCEAAGHPLECRVCEGHGSVERYKGQREDSEAWQPEEPPAGDGWQMWETTTEGSPQSPVFETPEELADYCAYNVSSFGSTMQSGTWWLKVIKGEEIGLTEIGPGMYAL